MTRSMKANGRHGLVIELCRQLLMVDPRSPEALWGLTTTLWETGAYAQSLAVNKELVRVHPNHWSGALQLANALETAKDLEAAAQVYRRLITNCSDEDIRTAAISRYRRLQARSGS